MLDAKNFTMVSESPAGDELNIFNFEFKVSWRISEYGGLDGSHRLEDESYNACGGNYTGLAPRISTTVSEGLAGDELNIFNFEFKVSWRLFLNMEALMDAVTWRTNPTTHMM